MTSPVDSITSLAAASQMAPVGANTVQPAAQPGLNTPSMEELTQRFSSMMNAPHAADRPPMNPQDSLMTHMMGNGEDFLKTTQEHVAKLNAEAPYMSPQEFMAASIEVTREASIGSFRMQVATSIASGTNKSIQSLLKNQ